MVLPVERNKVGGAKDLVKGAARIMLLMLMGFNVVLVPSLVAAITLRLGLGGITATMVFMIIAVLMLMIWYKIARYMLQRALSKFRVQQ